MMPRTKPVSQPAEAGFRDRSCRIPVLRNEQNHTFKSRQKECVVPSFNVDQFWLLRCCCTAVAKGHELEDVVGQIPAPQHAELAQKACLPMPLILGHLSNEPRETKRAACGLEDAEEAMRRGEVIDAVTAQ